MRLKRSLNQWNVQYFVSIEVHETNEYRAARVCLSVCHKQFVSTIIISDTKNYLGVSIQVRVARKLRFATLNFVLYVPEEEQYNNPLII